MTPYFASWTPDTGTHELPSVRRGVPLSEQLTHEITGLYLKPALVRYERPRRSRRLIVAAALVTVLVVLLAALAELQSIAPIGAIR